MTQREDDTENTVRQMLRKFDKADAGVAFRNVHGMSREEWIDNEIADGMTPGSAKNACRKLANAALVGRRIREQADAAEKGRAYQEAGERNAGRSDP